MEKRIGIVGGVFGVLLATMLIGCTAIPTVDTEPIEVNLIQFEPPQEGQTMARVTTTLGEINIMLFNDKAPLTVQNFVELANSGYYDNKDIYIESEIMTFITGAITDPPLDGEVSSNVNNGNPFDVETDKDLWHFSGAISTLSFDVNPFSSTLVSDGRFMVVGDIATQEVLIQEMKDSNYPQNVIEKFEQVGGIPEYSGMFTVFGQIVDGIEVANTIAQLEHDNQTKLPTESHKIISVEIYQY